MPTRTRSGKVFTPYTWVPQVCRVIPQPIHGPIEGIPIVEIVEVVQVNQTKNKK
jgi:hypothetical protein